MCWLAVSNLCPGYNFPALVFVSLVGPTHLSSWRSRSCVCPLRGGVVLPECEYGIPSSLRLIYTSDVVLGSSRSRPSDESVKGMRSKMGGCSVWPLQRFNFFCSPSCSTISCSSFTPYSFKVCSISFQIPSLSRWTGVDFSKKRRYGKRPSTEQFGSALYSSRSLIILRSAAISSTPTQTIFYQAFVLRPYGYFVWDDKQKLGR